MQIVYLMWECPDGADKQGTAAGEYNALQCGRVKNEQMGVDVEEKLLGRESHVSPLCQSTIPMDNASEQRSYTKEHIPRKSNNLHSWLFRVSSFL